MSKKKIAKLEFESARFLVRQLRSSDYPVWYAAYDSMFSRQNEFDLEKKSESELTKQEFLKFLKKNEKFVRNRVVYYFGIFEKKTGRLMGNVMIAIITRFNIQSARVSYGILNNFWKRGYGKEVVSATLDFAFKKLRLHRLEAEILPHNKVSIALVKSLGFQYEGLRRGAIYFDKKWHDHFVYAILAEDCGIKNIKPSIFE